MSVADSFRGDISLEGVGGSVRRVKGLKGTNRQAETSDGAGRERRADSSQ